MKKVLLFILLPVLLTGCTSVSPKKQMLQGIIEDDPVAISQAVKNGANPDLPIEYRADEDKPRDIAIGLGTGETPLTFATKEKKSQAVKSLLQAGANPNSFNDSGKAPLHFVPTVPIAQDLIGAGADLNLKNRPTRNYPMAPQRTPLMEATFAHNIDLVALLLQKGADIQVRDEEGKTAWYYIHPVRADIRRLFLKHGADPKTSGPPPAQLKALRGKRQQEDHLLKVKRAKRSR